MTIKILPAQLANQIAAGEVVERPASVVKELVENCLDAGATKIEIEIDKGGAKRILIRDNGSGIDKEQLGLALSRHATSKLVDFDDLCHIATLGFRGEALASISAVSRLTLSSRTLEQQQAWQAIAQGRDMEVTVQPTAHPVGTSIEVLDLFYNTPARRKFLRTEKTEFTHIDELIKRLALSRFDVALSLKHNGKPLRQLRVASDQAQMEKRVASIMGPAFINHCLAIDNQHDQIRLRGWLGMPEVSRAQNDQQYFYVNGRMMRDKLLQHAIRQSFSPYLEDDKYPAYVLYLDLPFDQVDVNVHPAKHEVRFHQGRLVHDYIVKVLSELLASQSHDLSLNDNINRAVIPQATSQHSYQPSAASAASSYQASEPMAASPSRTSQASYSGQAARPPAKSTDPAAQQAQFKAYNHWLQDSYQQPVNSTPVETIHGSADSALVKTADSHSARALHLIEQRYLLVDLKGQLALLDCGQIAAEEQLQLALQQAPQGLDRVPLLLPLTMSLNAEEASLCQDLETSFARLGYELAWKNKQNIIIRQVPKLLRAADHVKLLSGCLVFVAAQVSVDEIDHQLLVRQLFQQHARQSSDKQFNFEEASRLLQLSLQQPQQASYKTAWQNIDLSKLIEGFKHG